MPSANRMTTTANRPETATAVAHLIRFLETSAVPDGLFTPDAFVDLSLPHWRIQAGSAEEILAIRSGSHPFPGPRDSDIERDLTEAEEWSDVGRLDALHAERDALVCDLAAAVGLGGRARVTGSSHERARVSATKAITAAIDRIATVDAPLGRHLRATIRTCLQCSYQPDPHDQRDWILDQRPPRPK